MKFPLSVCMIVKNEEDNIVQSISSVKDFSEEIIVVDTGSIDSTRSLAESMGAKVFTFNWNDSFSEARNFSISKATSRYILILDADEQLISESKDALEAFFKMTNYEVAATVKIQSVTNELTDFSTTVGSITRLFPNLPGYQYHGRIHEQLRVFNDSPKTVSTDIQLIHTGYTKHSIDRFDKIQRNINLLKMEDKKSPGNVYIKYQLGKTFYVAKQYKEAAKHFQSVLETLDDLTNPPIYISSTILQYAYSLLNLRDFANLFQLIQIGTELYPDFTDLYFVYGVALISLQDAQRLPEIKEAFEACLFLGEPDPSRYETVMGVGTFRAHFNLGVFHEMTGDLEAAINNYHIAEKFSFEPAKQRLAQLI